MVPEQVAPHFTFCSWGACDWTRSQAHSVSDSSLSEVGVALKGSTHSRACFAVWELAIDCSSSSMMKLTLSTPHHALKNLAKGPLTRPNNFMMLPQVAPYGYPEGADPNKFTLITSFSSDRKRWMQSKCVNIHDP